MKGKGEKERYTHLSAECQRIARGDKKDFLSDQCQETEKNNKTGKTGDLLKKIRDTKGTFHAKIGTVKDRNGMDKRRRKWQPTPIFLPGKLHGLMSLVGYSSCDCKESDTTEWLHFTSLTEAEDIRRGGRNTQKNYTKKILMSLITTMS